ncbi:pentapeptide repeat-containing protein [Terrabacter sp. NPDC080008]|uniref:pentapeptide repeat-containing protein n=1 Tax=Terrabacter sp. NPDC080008 TaxID=3155176 RepID=UPI00344B010E
MTRLEADCARCFGLCCVALPFARSADFPEDKPAGQPCRNLLADHRCGIHDRLAQDGWRGCVTFDCFGAGQQVSQVTFAGISWREAPETAESMYAVLPVMRQLHEMLAHLEEALALGAGEPLGEPLRAQLQAAQADVDAATAGSAEQVLAVDLGALRSAVGGLLRDVSARERDRRRRADGIPVPPRRVRPGADLVGADLRGRDLRTADLRGSLLIAADLRNADLRWADLLGADLRDADLRGARLEGALFLTRPQLAAART